MNKADLKRFLKAKGGIKKRKTSEIIKVLTDLKHCKCPKRNKQNHEEGVRILLWVLGLSIKDADYYAKYISRKGRLPRFKKGNCGKNIQYYTSGETSHDKAGQD